MALAVAKRHNLKLARGGGGGEKKAWAGWGRAK